MALVRIQPDPLPAMEGALVVTSFIWFMVYLLGQV